jgi:hypothetical protein
MATNPPASLLVSSSSGGAGVFEFAPASHTLLHARERSPLALGDAGRRGEPAPAAPLFACGDRGVVGAREGVLGEEGVGAETRLSAGRTEDVGVAPVRSVIGCAMGVKSSASSGRPAGVGVVGEPRPGHAERMADRDDCGVSGTEGAFDGAGTCLSAVVGAV